MPIKKYSPKLDRPCTPNEGNSHDPRLKKFNPLIVKKSRAHLRYAWLGACIYRLIRVSLRTRMYVRVREHSLLCNALGTEIFQEDCHKLCQKCRDRDFLQTECAAALDVNYRVCNILYLVSTIDAIVKYIVLYTYRERWYISIHSVNVT